MKSPLDDANNQKKLNDFLIEHAPLINLHSKQLQNEGLIPEGIDPSDLHVAGFYGLMDALHKFKPEAGNKFSTYARERIRGKMLDHVAAQDTVPKSARTQAKNIAALSSGKPKV